MEVIEIKGFGVFEIKHDYLHRGVSRLVTFNEGRFKSVQFDCFQDYKNPEYQKGYDANGVDIFIKVIK